MSSLLRQCQVLCLLLISLLGLHQSLIRNQSQHSDNRLVTFGSAIHFNLPLGDEVCLSEDVQANDLIVGEFTIQPANQRIQVYLTNPKGEQVYSKQVASPAGVPNSASASGSAKSGDSPSPQELIIEPTKFAHTSSIAGEYRTCFANNEGSSAKTISFVLRTGLNANKDYASIAKQQSLKPIEVQLKKLEDTVTGIYSDMKYMKGREKDMRQINDSIGRRVTWMSVCSLIFLVSAKAAEIVYLRRYFHAKRLI